LRTPYLFIEERFIPKKETHMESKNKFFGHPIHPMLIVIPLGLFIGAIIFDTVYLFMKNPLLPGVSFFNISVGILGGLLAAVFGFLDWMSIPANTRAKSVGMWHGIGNVTVVLMFAISWWLRSTTIEFIPSTTALTFSYLAIAVGVMTAWLGGELVFRLRVGVDYDAGLNASSSLSDSHTGTPSPGGPRKIPVTHRSR
jgi:uncharacterized membrane protein